MVFAFVVAIEIIFISALTGIQYAKYVEEDLYISALTGIQYAKYVEEDLYSYARRRVSLSNLENPSTQDLDRGCD
ncbi:hypothetical protein EON63_11040 [archaeon]|nr:MAG: hypothetical protein EON63_11040 [archaeon]